MVYNYYIDTGLRQLAVNAASRIVYMNRNDFSYIKTLKSDELDRLFKVKVYVGKGDKNKYISEVYKINH